MTHRFPPTGEVDWEEPPPPGAITVYMRVGDGPEVTVGWVDGPYSMPGFLRRLANVWERDTEGGNRHG